MQKAGLSIAAIPYINSTTALGIILINWTSISFTCNKLMDCNTLSSVIEMRRLLLRLWITMGEILDLEFLSAQTDT
jgi:hypothetical protein